MKLIILIARIISNLFRPIYYPTLGILVLLCTTYLNILPWNYKLHLLTVVLLFTVIMLYCTIWLYRTLSGMKKREIHQQQNRVVPYFIMLCYYVFFLYITDNIAFPRFVKIIVILSFVIQAVTLLLNMKWKISMHAAGSGGIIGIMASFAFYFGFNPIVYLCVAILFSGLVMTSRMLLRQHTLAEVLCGMLLGLMCGFCGVILMY